MQRKREHTTEFGKASAREEDQARLDGPLRPTLMQGMRSQASCASEQPCPQEVFLKGLPLVTQRRRGFPTLQGGR
ncbi:hypothetical protein WJX77_011602 [Trebouxia sp. C0004]